jgi:hypothetical protein
MPTFHLPPTHCSVVLMSDYGIVACLSSRTVLVSLHVPMYSQCRHPPPLSCCQVSEVATLFDDDGILVRFMNSNVEGNGIRWVVVL